MSSALSLPVLALEGSNNRMNGRCSFVRFILIYNMFRVYRQL
jgi:hypothetical protein